MLISALRFLLGRWNSNSVWCVRRSQGQPEVVDYASQIGLESWDQLLPMIGLRVATLHAAAGTMIPLMVVAIMTRFFGKERRFADGLKIWKFAVFASLAMTIPDVLIAATLGPEFPSLLGFWLVWPLWSQQQEKDSCFPRVITGTLKKKRRGMNRGLGRRAATSGSFLRVCRYGKPGFLTW